MLRSCWNFVREVLKLCQKGAESTGIENFISAEAMLESCWIKCWFYVRNLLKCAEIFFQRIQHLFLDFQRNEHKLYITSAHSADFLQKYPLTAAEASTRRLEFRHFPNTDHYRADGKLILSPEYESIISL